MSDQPIASLSSDQLQVSIGFGKSLSWCVGNITIGLSPQVQGTLTIHKAGEIFRFTQAEKDDDDSARQIVTVPQGKAYVSIAFRVNLQVSGSGSFSSGNFGVKGSAQLTDNFLLANHVQVDAGTAVGEAIKFAFSHFVLPFTDTAYLDIAGWQLSRISILRQAGSFAHGQSGVHRRIFWRLQRWRAPPLPEQPRRLHQCSSHAGARPERSFHDRVSARRCVSDCAERVDRSLATAPVQDGPEHALGRVEG